VIAPLPVVADVHPLLALSGGGGDGAVDVDDRNLEERRILLLPDLQANFVDRLHQRQDLLFALKTPAEIPGGRGIGDPPGTQRVEISFVVAKQLHMIQARAPGQNVVGDVQNVIALVIRKMDLEHMNMGIDRVD
jgi:hypothetical protein